MTFLRELRRQGRRAWAPVALAAAVMGVVACGGGTSQVQSFKPDRVIVLGDESSVVVDNGSADGFKYSINDRTSTEAGKCQALPTFSQSVYAGLYGFAVAACNPQAVVPQAFILAQVGARVEDANLGLAQQLAQVVGGLNSRDLVTLMIGPNDVIALYESVRAGQLSSAQAVAEAQRLGGLAADQVNNVLKAGARALVVTMPDMGLSPYAYAQELVNPGARALLATLSYDFNAYLRTRIDSTAYDGRNYGLVLADDIVSAIAKSPSSFLTSPAIGTEVACTTASAVDCLTTTLVSGASTNTHLWADDRHLGPDAHSRIGAQAQSRAVNNPF